jgi:structural maintenance of chromosome 4
LDTATSIANEGDVAKWRVVTRTGNLIDTSGAMSGGGNSSKKGLMLLEGSMKALSAKSAAELPSITVQEVQQLEARVVDTQKALRTCRVAKETVEAEIKESHKKSKSLSNEVAKLQMALSNVREKEQALLERIPLLERECNLSPEEVRDIQLQEAKLSEIEKQIFEASPHIGSYRSAVSSLQRKIMDVGGPKVARAQQKLDILTKNYDALFIKLAGIELAETTARANASKAASSREKSEVELAKIQKKSEGLTEALKSMEADAMNAINKLQLAKARMAEHEETLRVITADFKLISAEHTTMKKVEMELKNDVSSATKKLEQETYEFKRWQKDLNDLRAKHISEQEQFLAAVAACIGEQPAAAELSGSSMQNQERSVEILTVFSPDALLAWQQNCSEIKNEISQLEAEKQAMEMNVNMGALLEYMKKDAFYRTRFAELEVITEARNTVRREFEDLRRQRLEMFMSGFGIITLKLKEMYQMITLGGDAELELVDSLDPFSEGIVFSVRPPKKSWKNISNLSGGEKTLSSLALVFALHHFKPTALYVMDEIDAALDFKNVSIVANYIKERTKNAQFVIISLRNNMFELADRLVGIYKTNDATKSVTINPRAFEAATAGKKVVEKSDAAAPKKILGDATNM